MSVAEVIDDAYPAARLTDMGVAWLREHRPDALIVPEFVCGSGGAARVDLAAITKDGIYGLEIKGDGDTTARLASQGNAFSAVCSTVHVLPAPSLLEKVRDKRPPHWAILRVEDEKLEGEWGYTFGQDYFLAPQCLLDTLWRPELLRLCTRLRVGVDRKKVTVRDMRCAISDLVPLREIKAGVCDMLLSREWTNWTSATGETRRLFRPSPPPPAVSDLKDEQK